MQCSLPSGRKMHGAASLAPFAPLLVIYGGWKTGGPVVVVDPFESDLVLLRQFGKIEVRWPYQKKLGIKNVNIPEWFILGTSWILQYHGGFSGSTFMCAVTIERSLNRLRVRCTLTH